jgi:hypothetical protein
MCMFRLSIEPLRQSDGPVAGETTGPKQLDIS